MAENPTPSLTNEQRQRLLNWRPTPNTPAKDRLNQRVAAAAQGTGIDDQSFGYWTQEQLARGKIDSERALQLQRDMGGAFVEGVKGWSIAWPAGAADMFGLLQSLAEPPAVKLAREGGHLPDLVTGNTLRRAIDLDPDSPAGMMGELFGGAETFVAKGAAIVGKGAGFLVDAITSDPGTAFAMQVGGAIAKHNAPTLRKYADFLAMDPPPFDPVAWQQTGWYKGSDGLPRFFLSDANASLNMDLINNHPSVKRMHENAATIGGAILNTGIDFNLEEILIHDELFELYPQLRKMRITLQVGVDATKPGVLSIKNPLRPKNKGSMQMWDKNIVDGIVVRNADTVEDFLDTVLHETQHVIQQMENFAVGGTNKVNWPSLDLYENTIPIRDAFNLVDEGAESIDDIYMRLWDKGYTHGQATKAVEDDMVSWYLIADEAERASMSGGIDAERARAYNEIGFVLEYLFGNKETVPQGIELVNQLKTKMRYEGMAELAHKSYENLYGEAEARMSPILKKHTQEQIAALKEPPHPAFNSGRTSQEMQNIDLSIRQEGGSIVRQRPQPFVIPTDTLPPLKPAKITMSEKLSEKPDKATELKELRDRLQKEEPLMYALFGDDLNKKIEEETTKLFNETIKDIP